MRRLPFKPFVLGAQLTALCCFAPAPLAQAISWTGDVTLTDGTASNPATWTSSTNGCIGFNGTGTVTVDPTAGLLSGDSYIGYNGTASGTVYVTGNGTAGSATWTDSGMLYDGYEGTGALSITGGGGISCSYAQLGQNGGTGTLNISGAGSTLASAGLYLGSNTTGNNGSGTATVSNGGTIALASGFCSLGQTAGSTGKLTIDGSRSAVTLSGTGGLNVSFAGSGTLIISNGGVLAGAYFLNCGYDSTGVGAITVTGPGSSLSAASIPNLGYQGAATLNITNGGDFTCLYGAVNMAAGSSTSSCTVNVDGAGSFWSTLKPDGTGGVNYIGQRGTAIVNITNGGTVKMGTLIYLGQLGGSTGIVNVDGPDSQWIPSGSLNVGFTGNGALNISGGAAVNASDVTVSNSTSLLSIDVGRGSSLGMAGGGLTNDGTVRIVAGADAAVGGYSPIDMTNWSGNGTYQAVGGNWNSGTHVFTVASALTGTAATPVAINPSGANQRVLISDTASDTSLGVGFLSSESALTVTAAPLAGAPLSALESDLAAGQSVLDGWALSTSGGYTAGDPAYLSLSLGARYSTYSRTSLSVWSYNAGAWSELPAYDLTCDGAYASFTATNLNGYDYAVTGATILSGDANRDGRVDINDLTIVLSHFGQTGATWSQGEFTGDGTVDINDLTIVLSNFGQTVVASDAAMLAVPEPSSLAILGLAAIGLIGFARRKRTA